MDLTLLREERKKWLTWKNIKPYQEAIAALPEYTDVQVTLGDSVEVHVEGPSCSRSSTDQRDCLVNETLA